MPLNIPPLVFDTSLAQSAARSFSGEVRNLAGDLAKFGGANKEAAATLREVGTTLSTVSRAFASGGPAAAAFALALAGVNEQLQEQATIDALITKGTIAYTAAMTAGASIAAGFAKSQYDNAKAIAEAQHQLAHLTTGGEGTGSLQELREKQDQAAASVSRATRDLAEHKITVSALKDEQKLLTEAQHDYAKALKDTKTANEDLQKGLAETLRLETQGNRASDDPMVAKLHEEKKAADEVKQSVSDLMQIFGDFFRANDNNPMQEIVDEMVQASDEIKAAAKANAADSKTAGFEDSVDAITAKAEAHFRTIAALSSVAFTYAAGWADEVKQAYAGLNPVLSAVEDQFAQLGATVEKGFGDSVGAAFGVLFDNLSSGKKLLEGFGAAFEKATADFLKHTGTQLIADGVKNSLEGAALAISTFGVKGLDQLAAGGVEIAEGLAMGGIGGLLGRSSAASSSAAKSASGGGLSGSVGSTGRSDTQSATTAQAPIVVNLSGVPFGMLTEREMVQLGDRVGSVLQASARNGGGSFPT